MMKLYKAIINFIIIFIIISCTNFKTLERRANDTNFVAPPDMEFFGFRYESFDTNFKRVELFATNAKFYEKNKDIQLYDTRSYTYQADGTVAARVSGQFLTVNQNTLFTEIYTNVVVKSSNNTTLYSEHIQYDNSNRFLKSPVPIKVIQEDGSWLTGSSLESDLGLEFITIYDEVDEGNNIGVPIAE